MEENIKIIAKAVNKMEILTTLPLNLYNLPPKSSFNKALLYKLSRDGLPICYGSFLIHMN